MARPKTRDIPRQALQAMDPADAVPPAQVVARRLDEAKARLAVTQARASATVEDQAATLDAHLRAILSIPDELDEYYPPSRGGMSHCPAPPREEGVDVSGLWC